MASVFAKPRSRVAVVGHGPSIEGNAAAQAAFLKRVEALEFKRVLFIRSVPKWAGVHDCYNVVNCDVNSNEDAPPESGGIFLWGSPHMKIAAASRGWRIFAFVPMGNGAFFTGTQAIRYAMHSYDCEEIWTFGLDFDDKYLQDSWKSTQNMPMNGDESLKAADSWLQLKSGLSIVLRDINTQLQHHHTTLVVNSPTFAHLLQSASPVRLVQ